MGLIFSITGSANVLMTSVGVGPQGLYYKCNRKSKKIGTSPMSSLSYRLKPVRGSNFRLTTKD